MNKMAETNMERMSMMEEKLEKFGNQVLEIHKRMSALETVSRKNQTNESVEQQQVTNRF